MESSSTPPRSVWRERPRWLLVALVLAIFVPRLSDQSIRGEESRWATVAREMLRTGDYVVPRQQGEPFPDRPPLHCWILSQAQRLGGEQSLWALRLPSVLAVLVTSLVIYGYARQFLSPLGALASGVSFATMAQVLQLGRLAESDALLICFLSSALLLWHGLLVFDRRPWLAWTVGYSLAALATLTKGPQGPVYFIGITSVYLLLVRRDWRSWLSGAHALGLLCFVLIGAAWLVPFAERMGVDATLKIWSEEGALRARLLPRDWPRVFQGWLTYPWRVLLTTLPWSPMLLCYLSSWLRGDLRAARGPAVFLATCVVVSLPTVWLPAHSVPRYFMSMYPALALLIGIAIERCVESAEQNWWQASWRRFVLTATWVIPAAGVAMVVLACWPIDSLRHTWQPLWLAVLFAVVCFSLTWRMRHEHCEQPRGAQHAVLAIGAVCGLAYTGTVINLVRANSPNSAEQIASLKQQLPDGARLVSLGRVHHLFTYYYHEPIALRPWIDELKSDEAPSEYFCFTPNLLRGLKPPFEFETIATINCARSKSPGVDEVVVIGRRVVNNTAARATEPPK